MCFTEEAPNIDEVVRNANTEIQTENRNLQAINLQLHEKYHTISLKVIMFLNNSTFLEYFYVEVAYSDLQT